MAKIYKPINGTVNIPFNFNLDNTTSKVDPSWMGSESFTTSDKSPKPLTPIEPQYPENAQDSVIDLSFRVKAYVNENGVVSEAFISRHPSDIEIEKAAVDAVKRTRFKPATKDGKPIGIWVLVVINMNPQPIRVNEI